MISLQAIIFLAIGLTFAVASRTTSYCKGCRYHNGIGFVPFPGRCDAYIMCFKSPYQLNYYRHKIMCCPIGTEWDREHLTCRRNPKCTSDRFLCPNETTTSDLPCPFKRVRGSIRKYSYKATHEVMSCPYRSFFDLKLCTCRFGGPYKRPCCKLLHFDFKNTYDSRSCYNFAAGDPYGYPPLTGNVLCLDGKYQFFAIPYLRNYFAWNPIAKSFTLCFWLKAKKGQTAGVLSTNCKNPRGESLLELVLIKGGLFANLGGMKHKTNRFPTNRKWVFICVCFDRGSYTLFYNAVHIIDEKAKAGDSPWPFNSQQDVTLGRVRGTTLLRGYFDDFCFWTKYLTKDRIKKLRKKGPSNTMDRVIRK